MSALLPCPFCGGAAMHIQQNNVIGCQPCGVWMADSRKDEWNRRTQPEATKPAQDESDEDTWRRLALQFDGHRMMALSHLRAMLQDAQKHAPLVEAFLKAPPMDGETVLAQRIAALASPAQALSAVDSETVKDARDWQKDCEILLDIWDDGKNPYENRCYVSGALDQHFEEVRAILQSQGAKK